MENTNLAPALVDVHGAARMLSISERSIWRMLKEGKFPRPVRIGCRATRWRTTDLEDYICGLAEESRQNT